MEKKDQKNIIIEIEHSQPKPQPKSQLNDNEKMGVLLDMLYLSAASEVLKEKIEKSGKSSTNNTETGKDKLDNSKDTETSNKESYNSKNTETNEEKSDNSKSSSNKEKLDNSRLPTSSFTTEKFNSPEVNITPTTNFSVPLTQYPVVSPGMNMPPYNQPIPPVCNTGYPSTPQGYPSPPPPQGYPPPPPPQGYPLSPSQPYPETNPYTPFAPNVSSVPNQSYPMYPTSPYQDPYYPNK